MATNGLSSPEKAVMVGLDKNVIQRPQVKRLRFSTGISQNKEVMN